MSKKSGRKGETIPKQWYFPSPNEGKVIVCDYNPDDHAYNLNCREVDRRRDLPRGLGAAVIRAINAAEKYQA